MIDDPWFYVLAVIGMLLVGVSKGGFGSGLGSIAAPMMALAAPVPQVAAIQLPLLIAMDVIGVWAYRKHFDRRNLLILIPGMVIGTGIGYLTFAYLSEAMIRLMIGVVAVGYPLFYWLDPVKNRPPTTAAVAPGMFWSTMGSTVSFVANAGGPPLAVYLLPQRLPKSVYVGTVAIYFAMLNWIKVPPYFILGQFSEQNLLTSLALLPVAPLGMWLGIWLHGRIADAPFYRWANIMLFALGVQLCIQGLYGAFTGT